MILPYDRSKKEIIRIMNEIGNQSVVLYGAGKYGRQAFQNIRKYFPELNVEAFIDDNKIRNKGTIEGVPIMTLTEAIDYLQRDFCILIVNYYISDVLKRIEQTGFDLSKVYFCNGLLIDEISCEYLHQNKEKLEKVYDMLVDYKSKMIYRTMIESRFTGHTDILSQTCDRQQYFPEDIFTLKEDEVFVDAGAFDGDTISQFMDLTDCKYKSIYAFEPDQENYQNLQKRSYKENVKLYNAGLYDVTKTISFSSNKGGSSKIEDAGIDHIQVYRFDELELEEEHITFVKMDIEGSELKALEGMQHTIKKDQPKLAICIYHKFEDLWELPLYIKKLVPEYRLFIRNYTAYLDEIVLYAAR